MAGFNATIGRALGAFGTLILISAPAIPQGKSAAIPALARLEPGLWQVRQLDDDRAPPRSICVADPALLTQVEHRGTACMRQVLAADAKGATVHYTCPAKGFGRTSVRVETSRLAKIDTQGIADDLPFAYRAEARRIGACG